MLEQNEYLVTWSVYILAVLGVMLVWWAMTRPLPWLWLKQPLRLLLTAVLLVPAPVAVDRPELAPAFFVYLFDLFVLEDGDPGRAAVYLVYGLGLGVVVVLIDAAIRSLFRRSRRNQLT